MTDRDTLTGLLMRVDPHYPAVMAREIYESMADAILAAGWVRCLHKNRSGFSNGGGPWQMNCGDCGHQWSETMPDWRQT